MSERPSPPPAAPRPDKPPQLVLPGTRAFWIGPVMMVAFAFVIVIGLANGRGRPAIPALLFVVAGVATGVAFVLRRRELHLWREGEHCPGAVTRSWTERSGSGSSRTIRRYVEYHYEHRGQRFTGQHETIGEREPGFTWVVCDPAAPDRSLPYLARD